MSYPRELVDAAKSFVDQVQVFSDLADSKHVIGWVVVSYDPETEEFSARGPYDHPRKAEASAQSSQEQITSDGSPGLCQIVLPLYNWDTE